MAGTGLLRSPRGVGKRDVKAPWHRYPWQLIAWGFGELGGGTVVDILATPFLWVVGTIVLYVIAYWGYGKWIDRNVWRSDAKKATPAHMYMDGVEYFPVSRYVLWGYQFKSVAALGPILGPFIVISFGWIA